MGSCGAALIFALAGLAPPLSLTTPASRRAQGPLVSAVTESVARFKSARQRIWFHPGRGVYVDVKRLSSAPDDPPAVADLRWQPGFGMGFTTDDHLYAMLEFASVSAAPPRGEAAGAATVRIGPMVGWRSLAWRGVAAHLHVRY